jgi:hypothetical protein
MEVPFLLVIEWPKASRRPSRLDGRQEQRDEHGDDRDHHQELDQGESGRTSAGIVAARFPGPRSPEI